MIDIKTVNHFINIMKPNFILKIEWYFEGTIRHNYDYIIKNEDNSIISIGSNNIVEVYKTIEEYIQSYNKDYNFDGIFTKIKIYKEVKEWI